MSIKQRMSHAVNGAVRTASQTLGSEYLPCLFNGEWIALSAESWTSVRSAYEPYLAAQLKKILQPGDTFIDVGSHFGLWSLMASKRVGRRGRVVACEPSDAFTVLEKNTRRLANVEALRIGLGEADRTAVFFGQGKSTSGSFVARVTDINASCQPDVAISQTTIRIRSLDSLCAEMGLAPKLVKVDVEGFELDVLRGASRLLESDATRWLVEIHPLQLEVSGKTEEMVIRALGDRGFTVEVIDRNPNQIYTVLASK